jgi:hypothetical protein
MIGPVIEYLAKQDKRYDNAKQYINERVRVYKYYFKTVQDDPSIVYSTPMMTYDELPFVLSFKLEEYKLAPSPIEFAV